MRETITPVQKDTLLNDIKGKNLTPWQTDAALILDAQDLDIFTKRTFFTHFLWESQSWIQIKEFREIREDYADFADSFIYDNHLVEKYEEFHSIYRMNRATELLMQNKNIHDIYEEYEVDRDQLRRMRKDLVLEGKLSLNLTEEEIKVKNLRSNKIPNGEISSSTGIDHNRVKRIAGNLLLAGLIDPLDERGRQQTEKARQFYDEIVDLDREGLTTSEIARELKIPFTTISSAKNRLRHMGEITSKPLNKVDKKRQEDAKELQKRIKILLEDPNTKVIDLPILLGVTIARIKKNVRRLIAKGEILPRLQYRAQSSINKQ